MKKPQNGPNLSAEWRRRARAALPFAVVAAAGFLLAFVIVGLVIFPDDGPIPEVRVPGVVGLPFDDAARRMRASGLSPVTGERRFSSEAPRLTVMAQRPIAGERVPARTEVVLDISEGQRTVAVPQLIGVSRDSARTVLLAAGLELGDVSETLTDSARGLILQTSPEAGQSVPAGTRVAIVVSAGPGELSMPDVIGRELGFARGMLEQLGLVVSALDYDSLSSLAPGLVVSQSPAAGAPVIGGSTVSLRVSGRP
ncbi:MAG: PASTA domain-containing protein [Gemmatimonadota bacterium]